MYWDIDNAIRHSDRNLRIVGDIMMDAKAKCFRKTTQIVDDERKLHGKKTTA